MAIDASAKDVFIFSVSQQTFFSGPDGGSMLLRSTGIRQQYHTIVNDNQQDANIYLLTDSMEQSPSWEANQ